MSEWKGRKGREERKKRGENQGAEERRLESWPSIPYFTKQNKRFTPRFTPSIATY